MCDCSPSDRCHELIHGGASLDLDTPIQDSDSSDDTVDSTPDCPAYSVRDRDQDYSRGMGHHLRWPTLPPPTGSKRRHPKTTSDTPVVVPPVVPTTALDPASRTSYGELPEAPHRSLRPRSKFPLPVSPSAPIKRLRVPVAQRWTYEPVVPMNHPVDEGQQLAMASSLVSLPAAVGSLPLVPRKAWMLVDDYRSDHEADAAWHRGT
jgi:hypothetical protein